MARYINADELIKVALGSTDDDTIFLPDFIDAIDEQPTADVRENVHGKWILKKYRIEKHDGEIAWYECSNCGHAEWIKEMNFCPNCGADMRGEENDTPKIL